MHKLRERFPLPGLLLEPEVAAQPVRLLPPVAGAGALADLHPSTRQPRPRFAPFCRTRHPRNNLVFASGLSQSP